ncbi:MAG: amino acid ABC transporter substrate-binding protein [Clostridia bacterium]|nr:amino acid ABC transporter substrate-binding protein [Clostridia bacterium]
MRRKAAILLVLIMMISLIGTGCGADKSLQEIKEKGKFIVGLDDSFPPMGFRDDEGNIVGFDIDMAKEVAKRMDIEVEFQPVDWDGVVMSLNNKDIDVIWNGLTISEERQKQIDFSKPYLENSQIIVVPKDSDINTKKDLEGKVVGLQLGSTSEKALNSDVETAESLKEVRTYENNTMALMDLANGGIDVVVVDEVVGKYYISKEPDLYRILDEDFGSEEYGVGIRKKDAAFKEELDKVLDEMKADGTADQISEKWFGDKIVK